MDMVVRDDIKEHGFARKGIRDAGCTYDIRHHHRRSSGRSEHPTAAVHLHHTSVRPERDRKPRVQ